MFLEGGGDIVWLNNADFMWSAFFFPSSYLPNLFYPKQYILVFSAFNVEYLSFLILPTVLTLLLSFQRCLKKT